MRIEADLHSENIKLKSGIHGQKPKNLRSRTDQNGKYLESWTDPEQYRKSLRNQGLSQFGSAVPRSLII